MTKISEAGREILKKWQGMGVKFAVDGLHSTYYFNADAERYSIPQQPVPEDWTAVHLNAALSYGIKFSQRDGLTEIRIPAQAIPNELLEMEEPKKEILIHHPEERMLWLQQRIAGTNEQWRAEVKGAIFDIEIATEPEWDKNTRYYPKPKTVKMYMAMLQYGKEPAYTFQATSPVTIEEHARRHGITIIGNIEERDVEV